MKTPALLCRTRIANFYMISIHFLPTIRMIRIRCASQYLTKVFYTRHGSGGHVLGKLLAMTTAEAEEMVQRARDLDRRLASISRSATAVLRMRLFVGASWGIW